MSYWTSICWKWARLHHMTGDLQVEVHQTFYNHSSLHFSQSDLFSGLISDYRTSGAETMMDPCAVRREISDPIWMMKGRALRSQSACFFHLMAAPSFTENIDYDDIEKHEFAQHILREHGTYFPKWASLDVVILRDAPSGKCKSPYLVLMCLETFFKSLLRQKVLRHFK